MEVNLLIVGGCFPVQNNIAKENLYHQIAKKEFEAKYNLKLNISIIRYERFAMCFEKISEHYSENPMDVLLFHIRSEQYLRMLKLFYTYSNAEGKIKRELNLPVFRRIPPEVHEKLLLNMPIPGDYSERKKVFNKIKIHLNYFGGRLSGNMEYAFKKYGELFDRIKSFCDSEKIKLIVAGPASRPHLNVENKLTEKLNHYFEKVSDKENIPFINLTGENNNNGEDLFFPNGIHVNEAGHKRAADLLKEKLAGLLSILLLSFLFQDLLICI